jgi:hypothetical protein
MTQDTVTNAVIEDLVSRSEIGVKKYNTTLGKNNHQSMLQHLYEELLDASQYVKKEIITTGSIQDICKKIDDDRVLGNYIRKVYGQK